jgi:hypothetical protein
MTHKPIRIILILLGLFHVANGVFMVAAPAAWYAAVPGVPATGPMNHHFIVDIGLAFIASGAGMLMAVRTGPTAARLALAGSIWPALHALFHVWEWIADGIPNDPHRLASDALGVMLVSFLGFALGWMWARREGVVL